MREQYLDGNITIQSGIVSLKNSPHATVAQESENLVRADPTKHAWIVGRPEQCSQSLTNRPYRFKVLVLAIGNVAAERGLEILPPIAIADGRVQRTATILACRKVILNCIDSRERQVTSDELPQFIRFQASASWLH